jgi:aspartate carbamoyltransferase regulatory subunit
MISFGSSNRFQNHQQYFQLGTEASDKDAINICNKYKKSNDKVSFQVSAENKEVRVSKIKDGTVIDHIKGGYALDVVKILGITGHEKLVVTIAINVPSKQLRAKDLVKIEGRALNHQEVNKIALVAPRATINIVKNYIVVEKQEVQLPNIIEDIVKCINPSCISNSNEPVSTKFTVETEEPLMLKCHYCGYILEKSDVLRQF